jgi:hypothetical protein
MKAPQVQDQVPNGSQQWYNNYWIRYPIRYLILN